jgi:PAS domain S-box-containing protein
MATDNTAPRQEHAEQALRDSQAILANTSGQAPLDTTISPRKVLEELLENEERHLAVFKYSPAWMVLADAETWRIMDVNDAWTANFGPSREEAIGKTHVELGLFDLPVAQMIMGNAKKGIPVKNEETVLRTRSGEIRVMLVSRDTVYIRGTPCMLGTGIDITDRKRAEEEQRRLQMQLVEAQKMESIGRLAGGVAHDFNNNIFCVLLYADLVLAKLDAASPLRADIEHLQTAAQQAAELTRQLLVISRKQVIQPRPVVLDELVAKQHKLLQRIIGEDVHISLDMRTERALAIVDPSQFQQVLMNLCVNARDAMPQGGKLSLETGLVGAPVEKAPLGIEVGAPFVRLSVIDQGTGMSDDLVSRIFEPFFTTKAEGRGTGLGLSVVFGIVQQHGGWIDVSTKLGHGTRFDIHFPQAKPAAPGSEKVETPAKEGGGETILLVEDAESVRKVTRDGLCGLGYRVIEADSIESGRQAFRLAKGSIRALLCDVGLPDGVGLRLAEEVAAADPSVRIVLCSGYEDERARSQEIQDRQWSYLAKPYTRHEIGTLFHSLFCAPPPAARSVKTVMGS